MINVDSLSVRFGSTVALDNVTFSVDAPEMIGVIGRSGAGKSTLLRCVNRLVEPTQGSIFFNDVDVLALRGTALRNWRASAAMIFQQFNLAGRLDVLTNVMVGASAAIPQWRRFLRYYKEDERLRGAELLDSLGMLDRGLHRAENLSGGQQQRVAIARALMQSPKMILADEPVASLDPLSSRAVMDELARVNRVHAIPVICNLHDVSLAKKYMTRVIGLHAGQLVFDGPVADLDADALTEIYGSSVEEVVERPDPTAPPDPPPVLDETRIAWAQA